MSPTTKTMLLPFLTRPDDDMVLELAFGAVCAHRAEQSVPDAPPQEGDELP